MGGHLRRLAGGVVGPVGGKVADLEEGVTWGGLGGLGANGPVGRVGRGHPGKRTQGLWDLR